MMVPFTDVTMYESALINYHQTPNISHTLVGDMIFDQSNVAGAASSFST